MKNVHSFVFDMFAYNIEFVPKSFDGQLKRFGVFFRPAPEIERTITSSIADTVGRFLNGG